MRRSTGSGGNSSVEAQVPCSRTRRFRRHLTYISDHNPRAAADVADRLREAAARLAQFPHIGHRGRTPGTFEWSVRGLPYIIVYEIDRQADTLSILAVFHGAQNR